MKLFTRNNCSACTNVKALLHNKNIDFTEVNVEEDLAIAQELVKAGIRSMPVLENQAGERFVGAAAIQAGVA